MPGSGKHSCKDLTERTPKAVLAAFLWIFLRLAGVPSVVSAETAPQPPDTASFEKAWESLQSQADLKMRVGKFAGAELDYKQALAEAIRQGNSNACITQSLKDLGNLFLKQGNYRQAEPFYRRSLELIEKAQGPDSQFLDPILEALGQIAEKEGNLQQAEEYFSRLLEIQQGAVLPDDPWSRSLLIKLTAISCQIGNSKGTQHYLQKLSECGPEKFAEALEGLTQLLRSQSKQNQAKPLLEQGVALLRRSRGESLQLARTLHQLATCYFETGDFHQSMKHQEESLAIFRRLKVAGPEITGELETTASIYMHCKGYAEAERLWREAAASEQKWPSDKTGQKLAGYLSLLGNTMNAEKKYADERLKQHGGVSQTSLSPEKNADALSLEQQWQRLVSQGKNDQAMPIMEREAAILSKGGPDESLHLARVLNALASIPFHKGDYLHAEKPEERALAIMKQNHLRGPELIINLAMTATIYGGEKRWTEAESLMKEAVEEQKRLPEDKTTAAEDLLWALGNILVAQGKYDSAASQYIQGLQIADKKKLPIAKKVTIYRTVASCYLQLSRKKEALLCLKQALKLDPNDSSLVSESRQIEEQLKAQPKL